MDLADRVWFLILGCFIGFALGYITRALHTIERSVEEIKHTDDPAYIPEEDKNQVKRPEWFTWKRPDWLTFNRVAVALVVVLTAFSALQAQRAVNKFEQAQLDSRADRCESGQNLRDAQRSTVEAVYRLAIGSAERSEKDPPLTPREVEAYNDFIHRVNTFRREQYKILVPTAECVPYVDDVDVDPPTPPYPLYETPSPKE